jgi:ribose 5-phosphate isomerase B
MKLAIGADWVGIDLKQGLVDHLRSSGHEVMDVGAFSSEMNDYPDFAEIVGKAVIAGEADLGIVICGTGIGMSIASNKVQGIRAALCHNAFTVGLSREHNDANVLALGAWVVSLPHACELVDIWLNTEYEGGRHVSRLQKIEILDKRS